MMWARRDTFTHSGRAHQKAAHVHGCHADQVHVQVVGCVMLVRAGLQLGTVVQAATGSGDAIQHAVGTSNMHAIPPQTCPHDRVLHKHVNNKALNTGRLYKHNIRRSSFDQRLRIGKASHIQNMRITKLKLNFPTKK